MNRHKKEMELCRKSRKLRVLKFDTNNMEVAEKINKVQDETYKKFLFYKELNKAISRR
jgi:hypothetical protein